MRVFLTVMSWSNENKSCINANIIPAESGDAVGVWVAGVELADENTDD